MRKAFVNTDSNPTSIFFSDEGFTSSVLNKVCEWLECGEMSSYDFTESFSGDSIEHIADVQQHQGACWMFAIVFLVNDVFNDCQLNSLDNDINSSADTNGIIER